MSVVVIGLPRKDACSSCHGLMSLVKIKLLVYNYEDPIDMADRFSRAEEVSVIGVDIPVDCCI